MRETAPTPAIDLDAASARQAENAQALADLAAQPPGALTPDQEAAALEHTHQRAAADLTKPDRDFTTR